MVLDKLGDSLKETLSKVKNSVTVDRNLVEEVVKEIQKSLLAADVNVQLVLNLTKTIRERAIKEDNENLDKKEHLITIIYEELAKFLGEDTEFEIKEGQNRILLVGLYGQGKTTSAAKLANYFKNRGYKTAMISTDTWRPAAYEQLKQMGEKTGVDVYGDPEQKTPDDIYNKYSKDLEKYDIVIIDSAGRDSLSEDLVEEISSLNETVDPTDTFLVLGADMGQTAQKQAESFKENLSISGVTITKMDGTAKGGGAISACATVEAPVMFIGTGEKIEDFERFNSKRFVSQLLGMGDLESLLERAQVAMDKDSEEKLQEKIMNGEFDLYDLYSQLETMNKMGSLSKITNMIPGMGSLGLDKDTMNEQEGKLNKWKVIMDSMTKEEKRNPKLINTSRIKRIATGSGTEPADTRELLKYFKQTKKMMGMFKNPEEMGDMDMEDMQDPEKMKKMMKKMGMKNPGKNKK